MPLNEDDRSEPYNGDDFYQKYDEWLRSDYIEKIDPTSLPAREDDGDRNMGVPTFEYAADHADHVVAGKVEALRFVPEGTLTTFAVDRTAKGGLKEKVSIYVMQTSYIRPENADYDKTDNAVLIVDEVQPMLFEGDRAVLFLRDPGKFLDPVQLEFLGDSLGDDAVIYIVGRGAGQFRVKNGKVREEKAALEIRNRERRFDGKSEDEIMDAVETRTKEKTPTPRP